MLATQTKKIWKINWKIRQHDRTTSIFSDLFLSFYCFFYFFCAANTNLKLWCILCPSSSFQIFPWRTFSAKVIKSLKINRESEEKNTQIRKRAYYISPHQSTSLPSPWKRRVFSVSPRHKNFKKIWRHQGFRPPSLSSSTVIKARTPPSPLADDVICGRPPKHFEVLKHSTIQLHEHSLKQ